MKTKTLMSAKEIKQSGPASRISWQTAIPIIFFAGIAGMFLYGLKTGDPSKLPSALLGKPVPAFDLKPVEGLKDNGVAVPGFSNKDLARGEVSIMNVWASWCIPCRIEHPYLVQFTKLSGAPLYGLNYKDGTEAARRFLGRYGNPFAAVGVDGKGSTALDWGVYGVPETFIIDGNGTILYKHVGPIDSRIIKQVLMPIIKKARGG